MTPRLVKTGSYAAVMDVKHGIYNCHREPRSGVAIPLIVRTVNEIATPLRGSR